jgi:plasmid stabilization system protein ParE
MKVIIASPVWSDLAEIALNIAQDNPTAALRVMESARNTFSLIGNHPGVGRLRTFSQSGVRSLPISDFSNYLVFYLPQRDHIRIVAVIHGARNLKPIIEERL